MSEQLPTDTGVNETKQEAAEDTGKGAAAGLLAGLGCGTVSWLIPASFGAFAVIVVLILSMVRGCG